MNEHDIAEEAYKNGYEAGKRDAVKHGRWTDIYDFGNDECAGHCSNCRTPQKAQNFTALIAGHRYCRWCGARMDGKDDERKAD